LCGAALLGAMAQQEMSTQTSLATNQSVMAAILEPVTNAQYQAEKVSRSVQTLSDGTVITHETRGLIARDAQGRIREDIYIVQSAQVNGRQQNLALQSATVGDPIAHTMLFWTGQTAKLAMRMQLPSLPKNAMNALLVAPPPPPPPGRGAGGVVAMAAPRAVTLGTSSNAMPNMGMPDPSSPLISGEAPQLSIDEVRAEDLGQQSLQGILVTGKRVTTTIPTGKVGNDRPIVVVHEEWRSPELKIVVKTIDTDPRTGQQTMELDGLVRADPDPALFQAPAGYEVKDMADMMKSLGNLGRTTPSR
jgi:hypothetical protein